MIRVSGIFFLLSVKTNYHRTKQADKEKQHLAEHLLVKGLSIRLSEARSRPLDFILEPQWPLRKRKNNA